MRKLRPRRRPRGGLTLMEVMLVLVILGILGSMAAIFLRGAQTKAWIRSTRAEIAVFEAGLEAYHIDNFSYPQQQDGLQALLTKPSNAQNWTSPYIKPNDLKDPWGNDYKYELDSGTGEPVISSAGPDGSTGTEDDITSANDQIQR